MGESLKGAGNEESYIGITGIASGRTGVSESWGDWRTGRGKERKINEINRKVCSYKAIIYGKRILVVDDFCCNEMPDSFKTFFTNIREPKSITD